MIPLSLIDAFTDRPFAGNPAGVCPLPGPDWPAAGWMQLVAREVNQAETAFVLPRPDGTFGLRWFTPTVEVELCGHATLAAAHVLWRTGTTTDEVIRFGTLSGTLTAARTDDGIELDCPADPPAAVGPPPGLLAALGVTNPRFVGRGRFDYLVEVADEAAVRAVAPDFRALAGVPTRGVMVTAAGGPGADFVSRFFGPAVGIDEDPVTGSAHCTLGVYWGAKLGRREVTGYQASARGGTVRVAVAGDRVRLGGRAVTVFAGRLSEGV